jgi:hypothetical protein
MARIINAGIPIRDSNPNTDGTLSALAQITTQDNIEITTVIISSSIFAISCLVEGSYHSKQCNCRHGHLIYVRCFPRLPYIDPRYRSIGGKG